MRYRLLLGLFFASGAAALILQVSWTRRLTGLFGSTTDAAAVVIAIFFAGLAAGNALAAKLGRRWKRPLLAYAIAEAAVAAFVPVTWLLPAGAESLLGIVERLLLSTAIVGLPAVAMGVTLPALGESVGRDPDAPAWRVTQWLYASNTAGGAIGAALAGMALPLWIGVSGSEILAMALLLGVAAMAAWLARRVGDQPPPQGTQYRRRAPAGLLALAGFSGFCMMALEVLWTRLFGLVFHNSVYTFAAIVLVVLVALAAGAFIAARIANPWNAVAVGSLLAGFGVIAGMCGFMSATALEPFGPRMSFGAYCVAAIAFVGVVAGLPAIAAGLVFPSLWRVAREREDGRLGALTGINTVGAVAGSLLAAFVLLPLAGVWESLFVVACAYVLVAAIVARRADEWPRTVAFAGVGVVLLLNVLWIPMTARTEFVAGGTSPWRYHPAAYPVQRLRPGDRLLHVDETRMGTVAVVEGPTGRRLVLDNIYTLGGTRSEVQERRLGHVPLLLHPKPERVAFIGIATGISLSAIGSAPEVKEAVAIEIVPEVEREARRWFADWNRKVLEDSRVTVVHGDGRVWIAAHDEHKFDVVVSDLFVPCHAGTGRLYAMEHFVEVRESLAADGIFALWLPLWQLGSEEFQSIAATFRDVFGHAEVWRGNFMNAGPIAGLIGWNGVPRYTEETVGPRLARAADELLADLDTFGMLRVGRLEESDAPRNTNDRPVVEFLAPRSDRAKTTLAGPAWLGVADGFQDGSIVADWSRRWRAGHALHRALSSGDREALAQAQSLAPGSAFLRSLKGPVED